MTSTTFTLTVAVSESPFESVALITSEKEACALNCRFGAPAAMVIWPVAALIAKVGDAAVSE